MIVVTCAVIRNEDNEVLVVQRGEFTDHPMKWEFPGGKLNSGETLEECVIREVKEELSIDIVIFGKLTEVIHDYGYKKIKLIPFICDTLDELPFLTEHIDFQWLSVKDLLAVDFSEADVFVAKNYFDYIKSKNISTEVQKAETESDTKTDTDLQSMVNNMMSMQEAEWVATSAIENPAVFKKLVEYSYSADRKLAFRASWTLTKVCDQYPELIVPGLSEIIESLEKLDNEGVQRCFLRIISLNEVNKISIRHHGILADHCFNTLRSGFSAIAIKVYSMEILYKLAIIYPELANELAASINLLKEDESVAIQSRSKTVLKKLAEIPIKPKSSQK